MSDPMTPEVTKSATGDSANLNKTKASETSHNNAVKPNQSTPEDPNRKPTTLRTVLLLFSVFLSMFLVAVDRTIISTV